MLTFEKDGNTKYIDENSKLIEILLKDGWSCDDVKVVEVDIKELKAKAEDLGIKVHHKAKAETIQKLIDEALNGENNK